MAPLSANAGAGLNSSTMFLLCSQAVSGTGRVRTLLAETKFSTARISILACDEIPSRIDIDPAIADFTENLYPFFGGA
jgi:hypothetical protein